MNKSFKGATPAWLLVVTFCTGAGAGLGPPCVAFSAQAQSSGATSATRRIGAIKSISGTILTLTPDSGPDLTVTVQPTARILRIAPGEKDLNNATPLQLQDLQVGDRILVGGKSSDDNLTLAAASVVVMTRSDLEAHHQQDLEDWQKRGIDGPATAVDATASTVTISVRSKSILVHSSKNTVIRRYAPDSVKFDEAKPSTLAGIHAGDQVRARGERNADGSELTADEIVSVSFRSAAATVNSVDTGSSTLSLHDLLGNKTVMVKVTPDSLLRQLSPEMAQRIAARLRRTAAGTTAVNTSSPDSRTNGQMAHPAGAQGGMGAGEAETSRRSGGAPDLQQMFTRLPAVALTDLHKGDAVILLSTEGAAGVGTVITLLTGVEPILRAAPGASSASILTPWSLSAPSGDAGGP